MNTAAAPPSGRPMARLACPLVMITALAGTARADSFRGSLSAPVDPDVELSIHALFRTASPIDHFGILAANSGGNPRFFDHHLAADPTNDLRILDAGIANAHTTSTSAVRRARGLLIGLGERTTDPATKAVVAAALAQVEWTLGGKPSWTVQTADKRRVVALFTDACTAHVAAPIRGVGELVASFTGYAASYPGYAALLAPLAACARTRPPEQTVDGVVVHGRFANGQPKLEITWKSGKRHGLSRHYYDDGSVSSETMFADNRREGVERQFYPSGALQSEVTNKGGFTDGPAVYYHANGQRSAAGTYRAGRKVGRWQSWDRSGALVEDKDHGR